MRPRMLLVMSRSFPRGFAHPCRHGSVQMIKERRDHAIAEPTKEWQQVAVREERIAAQCERNVTLPRGRAPSVNIAIVLPTEAAQAKRDSEHQRLDVGRLCAVYL